MDLEVELQRGFDDPRGMKLAVLPLVVLAIGACASRPQTTGERESGQSDLMSETFAGQNRCSADEHPRPFIIEWDATDASSFEAIASHDIVFVKYEACTLTVLESCRDESIRGRHGAYRPPQWTSGSLETVAIENEGELYAKLPLGAASLGGRVSAGERFRMEYYVAGTRSATRAAVHREDLPAGCEGATHFVYGYNLGAFALGSAKNIEAQAGVSAYGFGGGGGGKSSHRAEKKGGDLGVCRSDSATEVSGCTAPIRLTLRPIQPGSSPEPGTPSAAELASLDGAMKLGEVELSGAARAYLTAAAEKAAAGDGKGCIAELDKHDRVEPKQSSREPTSPFAAVRAKCLFLSGKCKAGKALARKTWSHHIGAEQGPEVVDALIDNLVAEHCRGKLSDRDALLRAVKALEVGSTRKKLSVAECQEHVRTVESLMKKVGGDDKDPRLNSLESYLPTIGPGCYVKAGDCKKARALFTKYSGGIPAYDNLSPELKAEAIRNLFDSTYGKKCKR